MIFNKNNEAVIVTVMLTVRIIILVLGMVTITEIGTLMILVGLLLI